MDVTEFEKEVNTIRAANGWKIELEFSGIWCITVCDKETSKPLAVTGSTSLLGLLTVLKIPFSEPVWKKL